jgi:hypothetical protein
MVPPSVAFGPRLWLGGNGLQKAVSCRAESQRRRACSKPNKSISPTREIGTCGLRPGSNWKTRHVAIGMRRVGRLKSRAFGMGAGRFVGLRRGINAMQDGLAVQCGKTTLALSKFSRSTAEVLDTVKDVSPQRKVLASGLILP